MLGLLSSSSVGSCSSESISTGVTFFFGAGTTTHSSSDDEAAAELAAAAAFVDWAEALLAPGLSAALEAFVRTGVTFVAGDLATAPLPEGAVDRGLALNSGVERTAPSFGPTLVTIGDGASLAVE